MLHSILGRVPLSKEREKFVGKCLSGHHSNHSGKPSIKIGFFCLHASVIKLSYPAILYNRNMKVFSIFHK